MENKDCFDKSSLIRLREMTAKLPSLMPFVENQTANSIEYKMMGTSKKCTGKNLLHTKDVAIQYAKVPKGVFPTHAHKVTEILIILKGRVKFEAEGVGKEYGPHEIVVCPPGLLHGFRILEDAEMIGLLCPSNGGYPGGET